MNHLRILKVSAWSLLTVLLFGGIWSALPQQVSPQVLLSPISFPTNLIYSVIATLVAGICIAGGMVYKGRSDILKINPEIILAERIALAKEQGNSYQEIQEKLTQKGWQKHQLKAAVLQQLIAELLEKGHQRTTIKGLLRAKGYTSIEVRDAFINYDINTQLKSYKFPQAIKKALIAEGHDEEIIQKKVAK